MTKKNKISAAIFAALCAVGTMSAASAATPGPQVKGMSGNAASAFAASSDRIVVRYKSAGLSTAGKLGVVTGAASRAGVVGKGGTVGNGRASLPAALGATRLRSLAIGGDVIRLSRALTPDEQDKLLAEIRADASVQSAYVSRRAFAMAADPNDTYYSQYQWHLQNTTGGINAPAAWDYSTGAGVTVAVLDTGILPEHPDRPANLLQGYDFITDTDMSGRDSDDRVPGAVDLGDWTANNQCGAGWQGEASSWHGSHVAGTIAEATDNNEGMAGVAYNATILPVRVLGHCGGWEDDIADAIVWASGGHVEGVEDNQNPAQIINMSLGGGGACASSLEQDAIDQATANGTLVVVAAGNQGDDASNYTPASCDNVVTVGATGANGGITWYSNYGSKVDLAAPGGGANSQSIDQFVWQQGYSGETTNDSGEYTYMGMAGTSQATPHVSATAALVQSARVANGLDPLSPAELKDLLKNSTRPFPAAPPVSTPIGTGIVDPVKALQTALTPPCDPETEECGPVATPVQNKVNVTGLTGTAGSEALYSYEASAGSVLSVMTLGGSGDVSVYVSYGAEPTADAYDFKSTRPGNSETVRIAAPQAGTYYIKLVGAASYSGVTLSVRQ